MKAQLDSQMVQLETQATITIERVKHEMQKEIEQLKIMNNSAAKGSEDLFRERIETQKDDRKDARVKKQAVEQSKLISQRKGERGTLEDEGASGFDITQLLQ